MVPWTVPPLTGVILAGGKSSRFGRDKASAPLKGEPLLQWALSAIAPGVQSFVIVRAAGQQLPMFEVGRPVQVVKDRFAGMGPLAGLVTGFAVVRTEFAFAASCDAPLIEPALVNLLAVRAGDADVVVPLVGGFHQPLVAVYRVATCLPAFEAAVLAQRLRVVPAFDGLRTVVVEEAEICAADPGLRSFLNANTPERLAEIEDLLSG